MFNLKWDFEEAKAAWYKKGFEEGFKIGLELGIMQVKTSVAQKMLNDGEPFEKICKWTDLSLERIKELEQKINSTKGEFE